MNVEEMIKIVNGTLLTPDVPLTREVKGGCGADLMSDVLAFSRSGALLVTGLASIQSVHTADVADMRAILYIHDKRPADAVADVARQKQIPLLTTRRFMFETCGVLYRRGLLAADKE